MKAPPSQASRRGDQPPGSLAAATFLSEAAAALARQRLEQGKALDVVHVHDFAAALTPGLLRRAGVSVPSVLTIHDARRPGASAEAFAALAGADLVTTVSGRYAEELSDPKVAGDLAGAVAQLRLALTSMEMEMGPDIVTPGQQRWLDSIRRTLAYLEGRA